MILCGGKIYKLFFLVWKKALNNKTNLILNWLHFSDLMIIQEFGHINF